MIDIHVIATGSSGNCYRITDGSTTIMIEAGIQFRKIREAFNFKLSEVSGCLVSHEHGDHSKAVNDLLNAGVDCYMSQGTVKAVVSESGHHRVKIVKHGDQFCLGTFQVLAFTTEHDAAEPLGFLLASGEDKILFATDTYFIRNRFLGLTHIIVEANYCRAILEENIASGAVHAALRPRLIKSHFEIENVKKFLLANDLSKVREIHLIHISRDNGYPERFKLDIQKITGKPVYIHQ